MYHRSLQPMTLPAVTCCPAALWSRHWWCCRLGFPSTRGAGEGGKGTKSQQSSDAELPSSSSLSRGAHAHPALLGFLISKPTWRCPVWKSTHHFAHATGAEGHVDAISPCLAPWDGGGCGTAPSTQHPAPAPIQPRRWVPRAAGAGLRDASRFVEREEGWSQVTPAPKEQAAASKGKYMPA